MHPPWLIINNTISGRWWFPPSLSHGESCESMYAHGLSVHQKCSNYALTNLLFGLCRSMWIINLLIIHPSPHPRALVCPSTPEVLQARECTPTPSFIVFTFNLAFGSFKECGGASLTFCLKPSSFSSYDFSCDVLPLGSSFLSCSFLMSFLIFYLAFSLFFL
jgi:hypothetical protein